MPSKIPICLVLAVTLTAVATVPAAEVGYRDVISSGATSGSNGSVSLTATLGQPIVGGQVVSGVGLQQGFWLDGALLAIVTCCTGRVGDADGSGQDEPTISDIAAIVDHMFISEAPLWCYGEADTNRSGPREATSADISIGDITVLIDYLFVNGPENFTLADCP